MLQLLFSVSTLSAMVRMSAPIAFAAVGSAYGHKAKIFNIGLESYVLTSAFFATWGSYLFESALMGLLFGIASGVVMSAVFGIFVLHFKSDPIVIGIAMNLSAWGFTTLLMYNIFHTRGSVMDSRIKSFGTVHLPLLDRIPFVGEILNNQNILVYAAFLSVILAFMNVLPIPALDGGYILFLIVEMITRRKPSDKFLEIANTIGLVFLLLLLVYANGNDIYRFFIK